MREYYTGIDFSSIITRGLLLFSILIIAGCNKSDSPTLTHWPQGADPNQQSAEFSPDSLTIGGVERETLGAHTGTAQPADGLAVVKVAILLPLSGKSEKLGQAMLNAAQMALFDIGHTQLQLLPKDTQGTPDGARIAAQDAVNDGAQLILGPVFSHSVHEAQKVIKRTNINMVAFSTDWQLADEQTFLIGFLPFNQVQRVILYARQNGLENIGVMSPQSSYGDAVVHAHTTIANHLGVTNTRIERFAPDGTDLGAKMLSFSDYEARQALLTTLQEEKDAGLVRDPELSIPYTGPPYDAVLIPVGGTVARQVGSFLNHYDLPVNTVRRLGTGLMDDSSLATDNSLNGAWFAAPSKNARIKFEEKYNLTFHKKPVRIASLAYDATALAAIMARTGLKETGRPAFSKHDMTNPNGFSGVDGIFRFRPDGIVERGLAILEFRNGKIIEIDPAPRTFQDRVY